MRPRCLAQRRDDRVRADYHHAIAETRGARLVTGDVIEAVGRGRE
jgi:hypothetical protein